MVFFTSLSVCVCLSFLSSILLFGQMYVYQSVYLNDPKHTQKNIPNWTRSQKRHTQKCKNVCNGLKRTKRRQWAGESSFVLVLNVAFVVRSSFHIPVDRILRAHHSFTHSVRFGSVDIMFVHNGILAFARRTDSIGKPQRQVIFVCECVYFVRAKR